MKELVNSKTAPAPIGPYSHAVKCEGRLLFISGQIAFDMEGNLVGNDVKEQTRKALENMGEILKEGGLSFNDVVKCTVLLYDIADFAAMNEVYSEFFNTSKPARAAYQVSALPRNALVEIEAIAVYNEA